MSRWLICRRWIDMDNSELVKLALGARKNAYAPYSEFLVGAAILCSDGSVFCGANVENASYSLTCCAERNALFAAVSAGKIEFEAIAVVGGKEGDISEFCPPCGACRQALSEFSPDGKMRVVLFDGKRERELTLDGLLPCRFEL